MNYTVVGFPRIGEHRELKRITESYWKGEIARGDFLDKAEEQCTGQWKIEKDHGLSQIPVGDFSLYDMMLDASFLTGSYPERYKKLGLGDVDTYFAAARGYQGEKGDVRALAMKKWFNTNYHYLVPELDDSTEFSLNSERLLTMLKLAEEGRINARPVVIGPFTFLELADIRGNRGKEDFADELVPVYKELLSEIGKIHHGWIQFDEPYLVRDLTSEDISLFTKIYKDILAEKKNKILLQTYFGDVRDCYEEIMDLPFDGVGLDFIEGKKTAELVRKYGVPNDKILFAGVVNGKNIWRSNYAKKLELLRLINSKTSNVVLTTSCSLLHVPYTVKNETELPEEVTRHFAFAYEKLEELKDLSYLSACDDVEKEELFIENQKLFEENDLRIDKAVRDRVASLTDSDFHRKMPRKERQALQRKTLSQKILPTTTIGSFPQTKEVKQNRAKFRKGEISRAEYDDNIKGFIRECIKFQDDIGLDVLVHGEFERNDMVEYFGENLQGFVFTQNGWVQSYGTRGVKPPIVFGDIRREKAFTVEYISYANSLTEKDVKGMLTGPVTILNWSFPREDISLKEEMYQIALALQDEVLDLEKAGVRIIQIDEAALREKLPLRKDDWYEDYLDFAVPAFRLTSAKVKPETQIHTHMCYSEFGDIIRAIDAMDADVISFEASRSHFTILDALKENNFETEVGPGVYDIHSPRVPGVKEIRDEISECLKRIPAENLWINPDCGLKTRGIKETNESLKNLVEAAEEARKSLKGRM